MIRRHHSSRVACALLLGGVLAAAWSRAAAPAPADSTVTAAPARPAPRSIEPSVAAGARPGTMCGVCHSDIRVQSDAGVHRSEGVSCVSCHGGDPTATTVEAAHRGETHIARRDIPRLCASCHSDVARMRVYNLPTDQYALYQTSKHGQRLAQGDDRVAVCTDCHGVHEIRTTLDPRSKVFPRNIPDTCGRCHGDEKLMANFGHKDNPVSDYKAGVHGQALLVGGNDSAPACTRCHGSHGATPPGTGDVAKVCGQCHSKVRAAFVSGPHKKDLDDAGFPECVACHGNHKTPPVTIALLDRVCADCHDPGSKEMQLAGTFKTMYTKASDDVAHAETLVDQAAHIPLYVDDYKARLAEAHTALMESLPMMHSLDVAQVEPLTHRAQSIAGEVSSEIHQKLAMRVWRYVGLALMWFYLGLTAAVVARARRRALVKGVS